MQQQYKRVLLVMTLLVSATCWLHAQSLADIARKEQAKKGSVQRSGKVITNEKR